MQNADGSLIVHGIEFRLRLYVVVTRRTVYANIVNCLTNTLHFAVARSVMTSQECVTTVLILLCHHVVPSYGASVITKQTTAKCNLSLLYKSQFWSTETGNKSDIHVWKLQKCKLREFDTIMVYIQIMEHYCPVLVMCRFVNVIGIYCQSKPLSMLSGHQNVRPKLLYAWYQFLVVNAYLHFNWVPKFYTGHNTIHTIYHNRVFIPQNTILSQ